MKIALHNELPGEAQFQQLIDSVSERTGERRPLAYEALCDGGPVIAAYDQGVLVGLGRLVGDGIGQQAFECKIKPGYERREIEAYMRKLLAVSPVESHCHC
ncbi:hypothetical protein [Paenibacillus oleatilyticus]|uniref:GNAT family N-acetyltransferase n=1 Tax=Paenibacillus oleatilyticus TaxID=2594886 RepID=A0ABV4VBT5_9BACL|nr:hypothetical protein [Paenibacillus oleatilyticus]MBU7318584.1 hypothetical protein [Paenibacillus oleatilyticus]